MTTRIQKWGNSLALRIPKSFAEEVNLTQDSLVDIQVSDGFLMVKPAAKRLQLDELLTGVTEQNHPSEFDFGPRIGSEIW